MQHPPAPYSLPAHSARTLNCLFNLTHNYRGNICVFCTSATAPRRGPTAKSSQLPLQLSQPESLIKTRCFHLGQLWKKSLPEWGPLPAKAGCCRVCHVWQSWHSHCTKGGCSPPSPLLYLVSTQMCYWIYPSPLKRLESDSAGATPGRHDTRLQNHWVVINNPFSLTSSL